MVGLIGGITELVPVSSSGHQALAGEVLFGRPYDRGFAGICAFSAALAVPVALWKEFRGLLRTLFFGGGSGRQVGGLLAAAAVLAALISTPFRNVAVEASENLGQVGVLLLVSGLLLYIAEELGRRARPIEDLGLPGALLIGLLETLAVLPGISRPGAAISGGLLVGLNREAATRFALLLSVPLLVLTGVWNLSSGGEAPGSGAVLVGGAAAFIGAYVGARLVIGFARRFSMTLFAYYLWAVGLFAILYVSLA